MKFLAKAQRHTEGAKELCFTSTARIPSLPQLPAANPDRHLSRRQGNPGTLCALLQYRRSALTRAPIPNAPADRTATRGQPLDDREFFGIRQRLLCLTFLADKFVLGDR